MVCFGENKIAVFVNIIVCVVLHYRVLIIDLNYYDTTVYSCFLRVYFCFFRYQLSNLTKILLFKCAFK